MLVRKLLPVAFLFAIASCESEVPEVEQLDGVINVCVLSGSTRAGSDTGVVGAEATINNLDVFVFGSTGDLEAMTSLGSQNSGTLKCKAGSNHTVYAVANAPASASLNSVKTLSALESKAITLTDNDVSGGFVISGKAASVNVVKNVTNSVTIPISRLVSRVAVRSIKNNLPSVYGSLTVNNMYLSNVNGNMTLGGTYTPGSWYNPMGRKNESPLVSTHIVDGTSYVSTAAALTFKTKGGVIANGSTLTPNDLFYCYPNSTATDANGFSTTMTARYTRLVITATIAGTKYYYPINIPLPERNTCYDVQVNIRNLGSSDPDVPVELGTVDVTITVNNWESGTPITENL